MRRLVSAGVALALVAALAGVLVAALTIRRCARDGPCYEGRTVSQWQGTAQRGARHGRTAAIMALGHLGPKSVPALVEALRDPDPWIRARAADALALVGPGARAAAPALVEAMRTGDRGAEPHHHYGVARSAASAMRQMGPAGRDTAPLLAELLTSAATAAETRQAAADALAGMGRAAETVAPTLLDALNGPAAPLAALTLARIDARDEQTARRVAPVLRQLLEDGRYESDRRGEVLKALATLGAPALPELGRLARTYPDRGVRSQAVSELGQLGAAAIPTIEAALDDADDWMRHAATHALGRMGLDGLSGLIRALKDSDAGIRMNAAGYVGSLGPPAAAAGPALLAQARADPWWGARDRAILALGRISRPASPDVLRELQRLATEDPHPTVRKTAGDVVRRLGPP